MPYCELCATKRGDIVLMAAASSPADGTIKATAVPGDFFLEANTFPQHVAAVRADRAGYFGELTSNLNAGLAINGATKVCVHFIIIFAFCATPACDAVMSLPLLPCNSFGIFLSHALTL